MKQVWIFFISIFLLLPISALAVKQEVKPSLILSHIKVIKSQENHGDELYFDVSVYRAKQPTHYYRIPAKPFHWTSENIHQLAGLKLWSEPLTPGETVTIIVSLIETDGLLINPDDVIGLMRVKLKNESGRLQTRWDMPNQPGSHNKKHTFELLGEGSHYVVDLSLKK